MSHRATLEISDMTRPTSLVTFLLDRSGSMQSIKEATIEGFNGYIAALKAETEATILFAFLTFDSQSLDKVCVALPIADVKPLTSASYQPRAGTPLIDAAIDTIRAVEQSIKYREDTPSVVICIQTDGHENESGRTWEELKALVQTKTAEGWQFNFLGAGIDAFDQAAKMGVNAGSTMSYNSRDPGATKAAFSATAVNAASFAAGRAMNTLYTPDNRISAGEADVIGGAPAVTHTFSLTGTIPAGWVPHFAMPPRGKLKL